MPKMKTHKAAAKRYKISGSGKIIRRTAFGKHLLVGKSGNRKNRIVGQEALVSKGDTYKIQRELPYGVE